MYAGKLAKEFGKLTLPLRIMQSAAGFYIGTSDEEGPVSRESVEYWPNECAAAVALETGEWTQREGP